MATLTLPGADIRGFYQRLGVQLPERPCFEASVRCFADPGAHRREDRNPSCSINVVSGAWKCHACGADGGAYDAAWRKGYTPRAAIDLMIAYGLTERRARLQTGRELLNASARPLQPAARPRAHTRETAGLGERPALEVTEQDIARWQTALSRRPSLLGRLARERGWRYETIRALELGLDCGRITIPIRDARGELQGLLRYKPAGRPKMLAELGSRVGLIPHPAAETSQRILLVEGPPDMIAARSRGLPAIAVPGDHAWRSTWGDLLASRQVTIVMDADTQGRAAARRISTDLATHGHPCMVELAPLRDDGYDLTDWLFDHPEQVDVDALARRTLTHQKTGQP
jgi:Toprim-like